MESCRPAIIVSFGVTAHWLPQKGSREAGIDSAAEFRGLMPFGHPRFETPRSAPVAQRGSPQAHRPPVAATWSGPPACHARFRAGILVAPNSAVTSERFFGRLKIVAPRKDSKSSRRAKIR